MSTRLCKFPGGITPCPKCGNRFQFKARTERCAEDCCEVWIECACGYDPTSLKPGHKVEDIYGSLDEGTILLAAQAWSEEIANDTAVLAERLEAGVLS